MGHKTMIGGTAYEITGGKTLVGGTVYDISGGKTLVGSTVYDVGFGRQVSITFTHTGTVSTSYVYAYINDTRYGAKNETISIEAGTVITLSVRRPTSQTQTAYVRVNGTVVAQSTSYTNANYSYTVTTNCTIKSQYNNSGYYIEVTTT